MRVLLDTHALLWWLSDDAAIPRTARKIIADTKNTVQVSAASAWEIAIKVRLSKLPTAANLVSDFCGQVEREGFDLLRALLIGPDEVEHEVAHAGVVEGTSLAPLSSSVLALAIRSGRASASVVCGRAATGAPKTPSGVPLGVPRAITAAGARAASLTVAAPDAEVVLMTAPEALTSEIVTSAV